MYPPPPPPMPPPMPPPRPPWHGMPAFGVIALCLLSLLAGCVGGAVLVSPPSGGSASATSSATPAASSTATRTPRGNSAEGDDDDRKRTRPKRTTAKPKPRRTTRAPSLDRRYSSCAAANRAGHGPYVRGVDPEYRWYQDRDGDGRVCEPG